MYLPKINKCLLDFLSSWNSHLMGMTHGSFPVQMYSLGVVMLMKGHQVALNYFAPINEEDYGLMKTSHFVLTVIKLMYQIPYQ